MSTSIQGQDSIPNQQPVVEAVAGITEDEAKLYDRQIRLWGVEAQNKMRTSSILLYNLRGISVEILKNLVLAGVGSITILDNEQVKEEDLGSNYFLREGDVGSLRAQASLPHIQALNPRVNLKIESNLTKLTSEEFLIQFDLIILTELGAVELMEMNNLTRKLNKKLFAATSIGMDGWIFADLLDHEFMVDKYIPTKTVGEMIKTPTKITQNYVPFDLALKHDWSGMNKRAIKKVGEGLWGVLTLFQTQLSHPNIPITSELLISTSKPYLNSLNPLIPIPSDSTYARIAATQSLEFPPSTAIIGGIIGQDILNVLGGKEEPVRNLFVFESETGGGGIWALGL